MDRTVRKIASPAPAMAAPAGAAGEGGRAAGGGGGGGAGGGGQEPSPAEKLLKYFPEAALALYITLDPMIQEAVEGNAREPLLWTALGLSVVLCWFYLGKLWNVSETRQKIISVVALIVYVAATGGPFATIDGYKTIYGGILAVIVTAFMVLLPAPENPQPAP